MNRLLPVCFALGFLPACGGSCNLALFSCDVHVDITAAAGGRFPDGLYSLRMYDSTIEIGISCPVKAGVGGPSCSSDTPFGAPGWSIAVSGSTMRVTVPSVGNIPSLSFELGRDGGLLQQGEVSLTHRVSEPNGPGCGECRNSYGNIAL